MEKTQSKWVLAFLIIFALVILSQATLAYKSDRYHPVHQHISKEAQFVWPSTPQEIKDHLKRAIDEELEAKYQPGDDTLTGSAEEDVPIYLSFNHFWDPDAPQGGEA